MQVAGPSDHFLHPWVGFAVLCGYAALPLAGAAMLLVKRDVWALMTPAAGHAQL